MEAADSGAVTKVHKLRAAIDRPFAVAVLVALLYGLYIVVRLSAHDWDASRFIVAGDVWVEKGQDPP